MQDLNGSTPAHHAAHYHHLDTLELLLTDKRYSWQFRDKNNHTALDKLPDKLKIHIAALCAPVLQFKNQIGHFMSKLFHKKNLL